MTSAPRPLVRVVDDDTRQAKTRPLRGAEAPTASGDHVRTMIDAIPALAWSCRPDGTTEFLNQRWLEYTGLSQAESLGWGWQEAVHPDHRQNLMATWRRLLSSGEPGAEEARLRRFDGEYRWFLFRAVPVTDDSGQVVRWYATITDIEERRQAEEHRVELQRELEAERDRLRLLCDVQQALVANLDLRSLFMALTASIRRVTECPAIGLALLDPVSGELRQELVDFPEGRGVAITEGTVLPLHGSASGKAFRTRQPVRLNYGDERPDPEIYGTPAGAQLYQRLLQEGKPAGYFLPLVHGNEAIGVIQLMTHADGTVKPQRTEFLSALAGQLAAAVASALAHRAVVDSRDRLAREQLYLRDEIDRSSMFEGIIGSSGPLRRILSLASRVAAADSTVLIGGETGTGKELIARAIHRHSKRSRRPFISVNCAAMPSSLIASELFGHEKGAFTGAAQRRLGRFELADGGTIFLDEIGEIPMETQVALLRVLQERQVDRVGGSQPIRVDVRVLAATNRDLRALVAAGTFREDLYYRLNVFPIQVPPLRERRDDIPVLAEYLIGRYAKEAGKKIRNVERKTLDLLQSYAWPGNIRELQNVIERAVILSDSDTFSVDEAWFIREAALDSHAPTRPPSALLRLSGDQEKEIIEAALAECKGRVAGQSGAARKLGVPRQTLESKIASLGINKHRFKSA